MIKSGRNALTPVEAYTYLSNDIDLPPLVVNRIHYKRTRSPFPGHS